MAKVNLCGIPFTRPNGKRWQRIEGEHKIEVLARDGSTLPIIMEDKAPEPNIVSEDGTVHSATYLDKYYSSLSKETVTLSVKRFMDFEVGCEFVKNLASGRNGQRKDYAGQQGYLVENGPQSYDFFFSKNGLLVNINATSPNVIVFFIPEPKSRALSIIRIIVGCVFIALAFFIGLYDFIRFLVLIVIGAAVLLSSAIDLKNMNESEC